MTFGEGVPYVPLRPFVVLAVPLRVPAGLMDGASPSGLHLIPLPVEALRLGRRGGERGLK
ncbi:hypothetical protein Misp02_12940 [Microtetraspora sp. NBRC 16547]|nr:hypothetical protein Misp02_12940 [Microtetraspora sp. NBRC 16547]